MVYFFGFLFLLALGLTRCLRQYALAKNIVDIPNHRSLHAIPVPRGGGVAFIIAFLMSIPFIHYMGFSISPVGGALVGAGIFVASLGFLDDRGHVSVYFRFISHILASIFVVYWLGGMPAIEFLGWSFSQSIGMNVLGVFFLVWLLNLYNFMDGIDGLAAVEAITVCLGGVLLYWLNGNYEYMGLPLALAATVAGFLYWNAPPAKIFMGDAGSGFLGIILGILTIQAALVKPQFFWCWLILLGVFIVDATITLFVRLFNGLKIYEAHRDHAFQHASIRFRSHFRVTSSVLLINVFWLLPVAILVGRLSIGGSTGLLIAYIPLVLLAIVFRAGRPGNV